MPGVHIVNKTKKISFIHLTTCPSQAVTSFWAQRLTALARRLDGAKKYQPRPSNLYNRQSYLLAPRPIRQWNLSLSLPLFPTQTNGIPKLTQSRMVCASYCAYTSLNCPGTPTTLLTQTRDEQLELHGLHNLYNNSGITYTNCSYCKIKHYITEQSTTTTD